MHYIRICFLAMFTSFFAINPFSLSEAHASTSLEFAEKVFRAGKGFNCRASGWFTGYKGDTDISFHGLYITVMPSPVQYDSRADKVSLVFEKVHHIIKVLKRGKHSIIGQLYSPGLASEGVDPLYGTVELKANYFGQITLIVSKDGKSKSTDFSCELDIDDMFK